MLLKFAPKDIEKPTRSVAGQQSPRAILDDFLKSSLPNEKDRFILMGILRKGLLFYELRRIQKRSSASERERD